MMGRQAVYDLLHRLGYSDLMPRPHHEDANPEVQEFFKGIVAEWIAAIAADHPAEEVRVYFQDEARFGTQGTITRIWARQASFGRITWLDFREISNLRSSYTDSGKFRHPGPPSRSD